MNLKKFLTLAVLCFTIIACDSNMSIDGTYVSDDGISFQISNGEIKLKGSDETTKIEKMDNESYVFQFVGGAPAIVKFSRDKMTWGNVIWKKEN